MGIQVPVTPRIPPIVVGAGGFTASIVNGVLTISPPICAWQVSRAGRPLVVAAGGLWSTFLADFTGNGDATDGTYEAADSGVPAPVGGILWTALGTYLASLGQSTAQATATLNLIWANAALIAA